MMSSIIKIEDSVFVHQDQGLKLAADTVLCEVRKKQADVKRMQDILRSLEKLRRLRKEAASRKGERQLHRNSGSSSDMKLYQIWCHLWKRGIIQDL